MIVAVRENRTFNWKRKVLDMGCSFTDLINTVR